MPRGLDAAEDNGLSLADGATWRALDSSQTVGFLAAQGSANIQNEADLLFSRGIDVAQDSTLTFSGSGDRELDGIVQLWRNARVSLTGGNTHWLADVSAIDPAAIEVTGGTLNLSGALHGSGPNVSLLVSGTGTVVNVETNQMVSDVSVIDDALMSVNDGVDWFIADSVTIGDGATVTLGGSSPVPAPSGGPAPSPVPEPGSGVLLALGAALLGLRRRIGGTTS